MSKQQITADYFRQYRRELGFSNQAVAKNFFGAKDISPTIDFDYLKLLNDRLYDIIDRLSLAVVKDIRIKDLDAFKEKHIDKVFGIMKANNILPRLNNQRRRPEQVYFSWMLGYIMANYFSKALAQIFEVDITSITSIGDDDLTDIDTFKRTAKADIGIELGQGKQLIVEVQTGFTGMNDLKQHKVQEAKKVYEETGVSTLGIHFDLYNGQVAFIPLETIEHDSVNWITRQQFEGQTVFNIDQNYFTWKITELPIKYKDMVFD